MTGGARNFMIGLALLGSLLAGIGIVYLPPFLFTAIFGLAAMSFVLMRPREGLFLLLAALYFPLFPNVPVGALEFSTTSFITLGLFLGTLILQRREASLRLAHWQVTLLAAMGIAFLLTTLFSESMTDSLIGIPNLVIYWMLLYVFMVLVRTEKQLWSFARFILVLAFILSIWRVELRPLRLLVGLPSLGINGAVFEFHPSVAIAMVTGFMLPKETTSGFWRGFSWLALFSFIYHGFLYQTRAGWLSWAVMVFIIGFQIRGRARMAFAFGVAGIALTGFFLFADVIKSNLAQTETTIQAALGETSYASASSDDVIRLVARDAGLRMFYARPVLGWGPNAYYRLKPVFVNYLGKEADLAGAFNSWLIALAESGVVGTMVVLAVFLLPLPLVWRGIRQVSNPVTILAFGFVLGVVGLSIHLLFIDLMYSFAWVHAGLALASARLALEQLSVRRGASLRC